jgi:NAD+ kinase
MAGVGLYVHSGRAEAIELAKQVASWLTDRGYEVRLPSGDAELVGLPHAAAAEDGLTDGLELVVSIGGDGTMLRAVNGAALHDVPVLGLNVGHLGYLTEVEPDWWEEALLRWTTGDYALEPRMLLAVEVSSPSAPELDGRVELVLNEAVVEKASTTHSIRLGVSLDGVHFTSYVADGLIVATPTGSTAYAFSARGPIVDPRYRAVQLTPVSPHMLFDRTLVLDPSTTVRLDVGGDRPAAVAFDGRLGVLLQPGDAIICRAADVPARFVTFGEHNFHRVLRAKFGLNER